MIRSIISEQTFRTNGMVPDARLNRILRQMVRRSFPRLRRRAIAIGWGAEDELFYYMADAEQYLIAVNRSFEEAPTRVLEGGIAHELCHIDADLRLGIYPRELAWNRYSESWWYRIRNERATEQQAIALGYGRHLLDLIRYARRLGYTFAREHGLFYAEILRAEAIRARAREGLRLPSSRTHTGWDDASSSGLRFHAGAGG